LILTDGIYTTWDIKIKNNNMVPFEALFNKTDMPLQLFTSFVIFNSKRGDFYTFQGG